jgi:hypothetical protein
VKKYIATLRIELEATAIEARDFLLNMVAKDITRNGPIVRSIGAGSAVVRKASVSRVRPRRKK